MHWMDRITDYGQPVKKLSSLHSQKSNSNPKFLGTDEAYFVYHISPKFQFLWFLPSLGVHSPWLKWLASLIIEDYLMKMCALEQFKKKSQTHCNLVFLYFFLCLQKYHFFTGFPTIFKKIEVIGFLLHWKHI